MKIFNSIIGIFAIFCSIYCIFYPGVMFLTVGWIATILMGMWGICAIFNYIVSKSNDTKSKADMMMGGISLATAVIAIILSIVALVVPALRLLIDMIIIYIFIAWIIISGLESITMSIKFRKIQEGHAWIVSLILGIIVLISGILGLFNIIAVGRTIGLTFGVLIMIYGVRLIFSVFEKEEE